ncbi:carbon-nitrogen hydrolase family protein [Sandaracinobacter sp. RS1-74]|uniref:carbon-nitrogen hydrolase family protein n=1 Tax=Sandaracinobacteroides sayramensis TaxID=2913411 RepID=UPI001EDC91D1|nr:carbon-nitrogen hydrolase family protein [Sandaracinobacteroides sayramensis]
MRAGVIQTRTGLDMERNARELAEAAERLAADGADILFTPEMCGLLDRDSARLKAAARHEADDPALAALRQVAKARGVAVAIGSLAIRDEVTAPDGRLANRSFLIGRDGEIRARYDKMHLFDVDLPNGDRYRESSSFIGGERVQLADMGWGRLGLTICYDVRFPQLHNALALAGADIIAQPAAFTVPTGEAHWHVLLRARAIETGAFVVAAAQSGRHEDGRETYGHSLAIDPWGRVLLDMGTESGAALVELDLAQVADARARIPNLRHARPLNPAEVAGAAE